MSSDGNSNIPTAAEIIARHQAGIWRYLRVLGCDTSTADDLTQETFLAILRQTDFRHTDPAATAAYLRRTAHNLFISWLRRRKPTQPITDLDVCGEVWEQWTQDDEGQERLLKALRECLAELTPRARQALKLRFEGQSARTDIGATLGITEHGAKNLMQRAKQQLRQCIQAKIK